MDMGEEAVKRNKEMSEDGRAKNLVWAVVGRKGEKRLVKMFADREVERLRAARGRGKVRSVMMATPWGRGGQGWRGRGGPLRVVAEVGGGRMGGRGPGDRIEDETQQQEDQTSGRR
jgi:hypothetical protein